MHAIRGVILPRRAGHPAGKFPPLRHALECFHPRVHADGNLVARAFDPGFHRLRGIGVLFAIQRKAENQRSGEDAERQRNRQPPRRALSGAQRVIPGNDEHRHAGEAKSRRRMHGDAGQLPPAVRPRQPEGVTQQRDDIDADHDRRQRADDEWNAAQFAVPANEQQRDPEEQKAKRRDWRHAAHMRSLREDIAVKEELIDAEFGVESVFRKRRSGERRHQPAQDLRNAIPLLHGDDHQRDAGQHKTDGRIKLHRRHRRAQLDERRDMENPAGDNRQPQDAAERPKMVTTAFCRMGLIGGWKRAGACIIG